MEKHSPELQTFLQLLAKKEALTAMLAPSFPIDFSYPEIVGKLKRLGFKYVVEVARGAMETNQQLLELLRNNPQGRFITAPCPVKRFEAKEDYPELGIVVLTYKEIIKAFELKKLKEDPTDKLAFFDIVGPPTRLYPISGGLAQSSGLNSLLTDEEYDVISGLALSKQSLEDFPKNQRIKVLDILFCEGGCILGQGIVSQLSAKERREKIISPWA